MIETINNYLSEIKSISLGSASDKEAFRLQWLSKKGKISVLFDDFRLLPVEEKKVVGQKLNELKKLAEEILSAASESGSQSNNSLLISDISRPSGYTAPGSLHPLNIVQNEVISVFNRLGFSIASGPEIEDDWHNFTALNLPEDHPARDMQDTFFINENPDIVLRTHTSPVQIRSMLKYGAPLRMIAPGRVYRCDSDATHSPVFHQVEGICIDESVSFADLKQVLYLFVHDIFGSDVKIRFRPSFFPFTEPSAEMDIEWNRNGKKSWMEILGCGMVDPNVLKNCSIDSEIYSGYAFGLGIERITMLKYGISDIRLFYENDLRFLQQFSSEGF
jgi:phenylalanyl-tRNA synthetase alpha chain